MTSRLLMILVVAAGCRQKTPAPVATVRGNPIVSEAAPAPPSGHAHGAPVDLSKIGDVTWDVLAAYTLDTTSDSTIGTSIPKEIAALSGRSVELAGFTLPLRVDGDRITELLLLRQPFACCYGTPPRPNDMVHVFLRTGEPFDTGATEFRFRGTLEVGPQFRNGSLESVYRLTKADQVARPAADEEDEEDLGESE